MKESFINDSIICSVDGNKNSVNTVSEKWMKLLSTLLIYIENLLFITFLFYQLTKHFIQIYCFILKIKTPVV